MTGNIFFFRKSDNGQCLIFMPTVRNGLLKVMLSNYFLEIRTLCEFVKKHKAKLFGLGEEGYKKGVNAAKKKHWELAAALINEKCATDRHWSQVRKKWKDLSYNARSKFFTKTILNG